MHYNKVIKDGKVNKVVNESVVDGVQYIDEKPIEGSLNPVTSGGVKEEISEAVADIPSIEAAIPEGAGEEDQLVKSSELNAVDERLENVESKIPSSASSTDKLVTKSELENATSSMESGYTPKGPASVSALNALTNQENGDQYIVTDSGTLTDGSLAVTAGESVAWDSTNGTWYKVNQYALKSVQDNVIQSIAPVFDPISGGPESDGNYPAGYIVTYNGASYMFKVAHSGAWSSADVLAVDLSKMYLHSALSIATPEVAASVFGSDKDVANATANTIYNIDTAATCTGLPTGLLQGTLLTFTGNANGRSKVQMFASAYGVFARFKWGGESDVFGDWSQVMTSLNYKTVAKDGIYSYFSIATSEQAQTEFGNSKDVSNAKQNSIYGILTAAGVTNLPTGYTQGTLVTYSGNAAGSAKVQIFTHNDSGTTYLRSKWGSSSSVWSSWICITEDKKTVHSIGTINTSELAVATFGADKDVSNSPNNTIYNIDTAAACTGLPTGLLQGTLLTFNGNLSSSSRVQLFIRNDDGDTFIRSKWGSSSSMWSDWACLTDNRLPNYIQTFEKIGICGGSIASGESVYTDSNDVDHYVDIYENSFVQLWAKKYGIDAFNFSKGGLSTKYWLTDPVGLAKAQISANKCKVYFTLFGGGNDQRDWDGLNGLGTIADVHVGNEGQNAESFYGNLSKIIASLQSIGGQFTKVICLTYPNNFGATYGPTPGAYPYYRQAVKDIVALYSNAYCIDLYGDYVLENIKTPEKYVGHFSAFGYKRIADRLENIIDKFVDDNKADFQNVQWIGTEYDVAKWMTT